VSPQLATQPSLGNPVAVIAKQPATLEDLPAPILAKTANVEPASGDVFISVPAGAARTRQAVPSSPIKGRVFVPLREARQIPVGSYLDTRRGRVRVATAGFTAPVGQTGEFFAGVFQVLQRRPERGLTELRLQGSSFAASCGKTARSRAQIARRKRLSRKAIRQLRGNATGRFRTRGRFAAATVRGTQWDTVDRCDGTLVRVRRGRVSVFDRLRHKTVMVRTGKSYLAKAPGGR
jgi:hypothetical protein